MRIIKLDSEKKEATITLSSTELTDICNSLYKNKERNPEIDRLHADFMMVNDLSRHSNIDDWGLSRIVELRKCGLQKIEEKYQYSK